MSAEQEVYEGLTAATAVTDLVADRIYRLIAVEGAALPLIVFERTATEVTATIHDGVPIASKVTISVSSWAGNKVLAENIGDEVQVAIRSSGIASNRFSHVDQETDAYAAVINFEIWET